MRIFLSGGAGDLGQVLCRSLRGMGQTPLVYDLCRPSEMDSVPLNDALGVPPVEFVEGSVLDRPRLKAAMQELDLVVHIAAWHGIHEARGEKDAWQFWDLNVGGTFNVFQTAVESGIDKLVFISSTSVNDPYGVYGHTKVLGEEIARAYAHRHGMKVIVLRPRAFIPPWNKNVYPSFLDWAKYFARGAVHISDVAQAVVKSIELLRSENAELEKSPLVLTVDGAYEYSDEELLQWDADGPGSSFKKHYEQFYDLALSMGLDPALKPKKLDISETRRILNYRPLYSMKTLLMELRKYGAAGPYQDRT